MFRILCFWLLVFSTAALMAGNSIQVNCDAGQSLNKAISQLNPVPPVPWSRKKPAPREPVTEALAIRTPASPFPPTVNPKPKPLPPQGRTGLAGGFGCGLGRGWAGGCACAPPPPLNEVLPKLQPPISMQKNELALPWPSQPSKASQNHEGALAVTLEVQVVFPFRSVVHEASNPSGSMLLSGLFPT